MYVYGQKEVIWPRSSIWSQNWQWLDKNNVFKKTMEAGAIIWRINTISSSLEQYGISQHNNAATNIYQLQTWTFSTTFYMWLPQVDYQSK